SFRCNQTEVTKEGHGQSAHLAEWQLFRLEPAHLGRLVSVRTGAARDHRGAKDRDDVGRLVAVRIGDPIFGTSEDSQNPAQLYRDPRFLLGLSDSTLTRTLVGLDRATDSRPLSRVNEPD